MKKFQNYIFSNKINLIITLLLIFSIFSALIIGQSWDEGYHLKHGKVTFNYLLSFGLINEKLEFREYYSSIYFTLKYLVTSFFPYQFKTEVGHLVNLSLSWGSLFGFSKIGKIIFNKAYPDGVKIRKLECKKINILGWKPKILLKDGLTKYYDYFRQLESKKNNF